MSGTRTTPTPGARAPAVTVGAVVALLACAVAPPLPAQTDYYNTDAGRPVLVEDALPIERHALELQVAPLRAERAGGGVYRWEVEPEVAYGVLPRTQLEVGLPLAAVDAGTAGHATGLAGIDVSVLHSLNTETAVPGLAVVGSVLAPVGGLGPDRPYASVKGIATRTLSWARFHANARYTFGPGVSARPNAVGAVELSRWLAGVAADRTFPLRSLLVTGEVTAREPLHSDADVEWSAGAGLRLQANPRWALDGGFGRRLTGDERGWYVTAGAAYAFGLAALIPLRGR